MDGKIDGKTLIPMHGKITTEIHLAGMPKEKIEKIVGLAHSVALGTLCVKNRIQSMIPKSILWSQP